MQGVDEGVGATMGTAPLGVGGVVRAEAISIRAKTGARKLQSPHRRACSKPHKVPLTRHWASSACLPAHLTVIAHTHLMRESILVCTVGTTIVMSVA